MSILRKLNNRVVSDGLILGGFHLFARCVRTVRSRIYGFVLDAKLLDIGTGCYIKGRKHIKFGTGISIFKNIWLEAVTQHHGTVFFPTITLGSRISFSNNVHVSCINRVSIGDDVLIGSNVHISDHNHGDYGMIACSSPDIPPAIRKLCSTGVVSIEERVWIGDNVVIIGPVHVGAGAVIGANSVVRSDVPAATVVVGVPARSVKVFDSAKKMWVKH